MSFSSSLALKPFSKTRWTAKICRVDSRCLRLCAPSTACTVWEFLQAARVREGTRGGPGELGRQTDPRTQQSGAPRPREPRPREPRPRGRYLGPLVERPLLGR